MAKLITKYTGLQNASKIDSVKACMIKEYEVSPAEAEFYIQNPPAYLFITESENEAKLELKKLLLAGAKASIQDVATMTKEELEAASKLILEFDEYIKPEEKKLETSIELKSRSSFSVDISKIAGNIGLFEKGGFRVPWEYIIPTIVGISVMLFMSYLLFPKPPSSIIEQMQADVPSKDIHFYKYSGDYKDSQIKVDVAMTATDRGVKFANIIIKTPAAQQQAEEEIVLNKPASPWLSQISISKIEYTFNEKDKVFDGTGPAKIMLEQGDQKLEVNLPVISRVRYTKGQKTVQAAFMIKYRIEDIAEDKTYYISSNNNNYSFFIKFQAELKLDSISNSN